MFKRIKMSINGGINVQRCIYGHLYVQWQIVLCRPVDDRPLFVGMSISLSPTS